MARGGVLSDGAATSYTSARTVVGDIVSRVETPGMVLFTTDAMETAAAARAERQGERVGDDGFVFFDRGLAVRLFPFCLVEPSTAGMPLLLS